MSRLPDLVLDSKLETQISSEEQETVVEVVEYTYHFGDKGNALIARKLFDRVRDLLASP